MRSFESQRSSGGAPMDSTLRLGARWGICPADASRYSPGRSPALAGYSLVPAVTSPVS